MVKGLPVAIYKNPSYAECSNGGISSYANEVLVIGAGIPEIFEANGRPVVRVVKGNLPGTVKAVPVEPGKGCGPMFGGAYIACSDGRFCDAVEKIVGARFYGAVALHDRYEA